MFKLIGSMKWYWQVLIVVVLVGATTLGADAWKAHGLTKSQEALNIATKQWNEERAKLIADAEARERHIEELEPQVLAYKAMAQQGKILDEAKAKQIDEVIKKENSDEENANKPTDCNVRATHLCDMFRATDKRFDCATLFAQCQK